MLIRSYSQNLEDVVLDRVFGNQAKGFYLDVGAGPPRGNSVTKNLYLMGWNGFLFEPVPEFAQELEKLRPRDRIFQAALGTSEGKISFKVVPNTGLSTTKLDLTIHPKFHGDSYIIDVEQLSLNSVLIKENIKNIDLLKIDVEGGELEVLMGIDLNKYQPRIILVESVVPGQGIKNDSTVTNYLKLFNYSEALFDGLNTFYCHNQDQDLFHLLKAPVNIFDGDFFRSKDEHYPEVIFESYENELRLLKDRVVSIEQENNSIKSSLVFKIFLFIKYLK